MAKEVIAKIKNRADGSANWSNTNPVLEIGELGLETDTNKIKFGDGITTWNSLAYFVSGINITQGTTQPLNGWWFKEI